MLHWDGTNWVGMRGDGTWADGIPITGRREPWKDLRPQPPHEHGDFTTVEDFLRYVVAGSDYKLDDVVAIGIGTSHSIQGEKLHAVYLTQRGTDEFTEPGVLREPYERLKAALALPEVLCELGPDNLATVVRSITPDPLSESSNIAKTLINWGGPDGKKRVVAVYSKDTTSQIFGQI